MNVDRRMRCEEGEYDAPVTPERLVFFQNVLGRTSIYTVYISIRKSNTGHHNSHRGGGGGTKSKGSRAAGRAALEVVNSRNSSSKVTFPGGVERGRRGGRGRSVFMYGVKYESSCARRMGDGVADGEAGCSVSFLTTSSGTSKSSWLTTMTGCGTLMVTSDMVGTEQEQVEF